MSHLAYLAERSGTSRFHYQVWGSHTMFGGKSLRGSVRGTLNNHSYLSQFTTRSPFLLDSLLLSQMLVPFPKQELKNNCSTIFQDFFLSLIKKIHWYVVNSWMNFVWIYSLFPSTFCTRSMGKSWRNPKWRWRKEGVNNLASI